MSMAGASAISGLAQNKWTPIVLGVVVLGGVALLYFGVFRPAMCKLGLATCRTDEKKAKLIQDIVKFDGFNPNYYNPASITIDPTRAKILADNVDDAMGLFNDNEEIIYGILREIGNKNNLSLISKEFKIRHGEGMGEFITNKINGDEELKTIWNILQGY